MNKPTGIIRHPSGDEYAGLIETWIIVDIEVVSDSVLGEVLTGVGEGTNRHHGNRNMRLQALAARLRVAADLERAAKRRQLRTKPTDMTCHARLSGLERKIGYRLGGVARDKKHDSRDEEGEQGQSKRQNSAAEEGLHASPSIAV